MAAPEVPQEDGIRGEPRRQRVPLNDLPMLRQTSHRQNNQKHLQDIIICFRQNDCATVKTYETRHLFTSCVHSTTKNPTEISPNFH